MVIIDAQLFAEILVIITFCIAILVVVNETSRRKCADIELKKLLQIPDTWPCSKEHFDHRKLNDQQKFLLTKLSQCIPKPLQQLSVETIEQPAAKVLFGSQIVAGFRYLTNPINGYNYFGNYAELTISIFGSGTVIVSFRGKVLKEAFAEFVEMITTNSFNDTMNNIIELDIKYKVGLIAKRDEVRCGNN